MSNPERGNFDEIVESLQSDDSLEQGRLIYSATDMGVPLRELIGYRADGESQFQHYTQRCDVYSCNPVADNFRLPQEWVKQFWDPDTRDIVIQTYIDQHAND